MLIRQAAALENALDTEHLWQGLCDVLKTQGISHVIYLTVNQDFKEPFSRVSFENLYSDALPAEDPFLAHCCDSYDITPTGLAFLDQHDYLSPQAKAFIRTAAERGGFQSGLGIPMRLKGSGRFGGFNIGTLLDRDAFMEHIWPRAEEFRLFCLMMHRRFEELRTAEAPKEKYLMAPALPSQLDALSPREKEVAYLLAQGRSRKEVAHICDISIHTVSDYTKSTYSKLGIRNRAQLIRMTYEK